MGRQRPEETSLEALPLPCLSGTSGHGIRELLDMQASVGVTLGVEHPARQFPRGISLPRSRTRERPQMRIWPSKSEHSDGDAPIVSICRSVTVSTASRTRHAPSEGGCQRAGDLSRSSGRWRPTCSARAAGSLLVPRAGNAGARSKRGTYGVPFPRVSCKKEWAEVFVCFMPLGQPPLKTNTASTHGTNREARMSVSETTG